MVHKFVGQEPSGGKFNALELDYNSEFYKFYFSNISLLYYSMLIFVSAEKPHNPMVNTGSIVINSLLQTLMKPEMSTAEKFDYINDYIKVM